MHGPDIELVRTGILAIDDLITVRRGELIVPPMATQPVAAQTEWIKVKGSGGDWRCRFFDVASSQCAIYENRPFSCRALKCWDTGEILAMAGRDLAARADLMADDDPMRGLVACHEQQCPVPDMERIAVDMNNADQRRMLFKELTGPVNVDLRIRSQAVRDFDISVDREMFYFGRPLFQLLYPLGVTAVETPRGVELQFRGDVSDVDS